MTRLHPNRRTVLFGCGAAMAVLVLASAGQELMTLPETPAFDEHDWIGMFRHAGYSIAVDRGVIFVDLGDVELRPLPASAQATARAWQRRTPDWKRRVIAALNTEQIPTT